MPQDNCACALKHAICAERKGSPVQYQAPDTPAAKPESEAPDNRNEQLPESK
jgi:hypothetical protein